MVVGTQLPALKGMLVNPGTLKLSQLGGLYPGGLGASAARVREEALFDPQWEVRVGVVGRDATLRFGVELADGRGATNLDRRPFDLPPGVLRGGPVLSQGGGYGGATNWGVGLLAVAAAARGVL